MKQIYTAALAALLALPAAAHDYTVAKIVVTHPVAFETPKTARVGGGYMTLTNNGKTADRLTGINADGFDEVSLHESSTDDMGVARMQPLDGIDLPAGAAVALEPGGMHVMFIGLNDGPFAEGDEISATLTFEKAGPLDVTFNVENRRAAHDGKMDHSEQH